MIELRFVLSLFSIFFALTGSAAAQSSAGYDVFLLVGQSNMVGYGTGPDSASDASVSPRVFMWDANQAAIVPAKDPLVHNQVPGFVGLGLTFGKAYAATMAANRNVLLVGSATGGTGFYNGWWQAPNGPLATTAVARANAAMAAAGQGARFAGILWHQGEADDIYGTDPSLYSSYLSSLISYFRTNIQGASPSTPFVVGEWCYDWITSNLASQQYISSQTGILQFLHQLPDRLNNTAWVSAAGLSGDTDDYQIIHFGALSQRQLGRRYADRFLEAAQNLPQPALAVKSWSGRFWDDGRSFNNGQIPVNFGAFVTGAVGVVTDAARGNVARVSQAQGYLNYLVPGNTFNGSYTKMAWFKPGLPNYANNLISGVSPGQGHYLAVPTFNNSISVVAGHSDDKSVAAYIYQPITVAPGAWVDLCVVYDAAARTMKLYVNGAITSTASHVPPAPALSGGPVNLTIGNYGSISGTGVDGSMAAQRVWSTALTADQIAALYKYEQGYRSGW